MEKLEYSKIEIIKDTPQCRTRKGKDRNRRLICGGKFERRGKAQPPGRKRKDERKEQKNRDGSIREERSEEGSSPRDGRGVVGGVLFLMNISSLSRSAAALPGIKTACKEHTVPLLRHGSILEDGG